MQLSAMEKDLVHVQNFINGQFVEASRYLDSWNPATGKVWARIPDSGQEEVDLAVRAAQDAFPG